MHGQFHHRGESYAKGEFYNMKGNVYIDFLSVQPKYELGY